MDQKKLMHLYFNKKKSVAEIATIFFCSESRINYWFNKYAIPKRSIGDAIYLKRNIHGDPFSKKILKTPYDHFLFGLGLGLYWGEGNKLNKNSIKLGNTNPYLIKRFMEFLETIYQIEKTKYRFGLQLFNDSNPKEALEYWCSALKANKSQFQKIVISEVRGEGTYKNKSKYGVLTVYFNNVKLRNVIISEIEKLSVV